MSLPTERLRLRHIVSVGLLMLFGTWLVAIKLKRIGLL